MTKKARKSANIKLKSGRLRKGEDRAYFDEKFEEKRIFFDLYMDFFAVELKTSLYLEKDTR